MPTPVALAIAHYHRCTCRPDTKIPPRELPVAQSMGLPMVQFMLPGGAAPYRTMVEAAEAAVGAAPSSVDEILRQISVCLDVTGIADETDDSSRIITATLRTIRDHLVSVEAHQE